MLSQSIFTVLFLSFVFVSSVLCESEEKTLYDEFIGEVIDIDAIKQSVAAAIGDADTEETMLVALKMIDASTKIPSGLAVLNMFDLGNFDECYGIKYNDIYGKYCLGTLAVSGFAQKYFKILGQNATLPQRMPFLHPTPRLAGLMDPRYIGFHFAACVPHVVPASEIPGLLTYTEEFCYSKATEPDLSVGAIVTIVVLAIFGAIIVASTSYDLILYYLRKEPRHELLIAFSFLTNGRKIFKSTTNSDQLLCLNGIKVISMMWVIIGHEYSNANNAPLSNFQDVQDWQNDPANMFINGATVSVDSFFVAGGLVTVYIFLKVAKKGVKFNIILYYVHRYLRLTPAFAMVGLIHLFLLNYMGNGPLWKVVDITLVDTCEKGWWSSLLYITNYVQKGICVPQTWYLSVDMQLFILSPLVLLPLSKWPKVGLGLLGVLIIAGSVVPFAVGYSENLSASMSGPDVVKFINDYYMQTHTRFSPYVIGMALGYLIYKIKMDGFRVQLKPMFVLLLWAICLTGLTACVYAGFSLTVSAQDDIWGNSMYLAFNRPAWAVALAGVIFLCVNGYGGPVDSFLSLPIFQFVAKLSYSMYLVHYTVIIVRYSQLRNNIKFTDLTIMHLFWGDFMLTLVLSLILCLSFESPIITLERYLFGSHKSNTTQKPVEKKKLEV